MARRIMFSFTFCIQVWYIFFCVTCLQKYSRYWVYFLHWSSYSSIPPSVLRIFLNLSKKYVEEKSFHLCPTFPTLSIFPLKVHSLPITNISSLSDKNCFIHFSGGTGLSHRRNRPHPAHHPRGRARCLSYLPWDFPPLTFSAIAMTEQEFDTSLLKWSFNTWNALSVFLR